MRFTWGWGPKWHSQRPNLSLFSASFFTLFGPILTKMIFFDPPKKGPKKAWSKYLGGFRKYPYLTSRMGGSESTLIYRLKWGRVKTYPYLSSKMRGQKAFYRVLGSLRTYPPTHSPSSDVQNKRKFTCKALRTYLDLSYFTAVLHSFCIPMFKININSHAKQLIFRPPPTPQ